MIASAAMAFCSLTAAASTTSMPTGSQTWSGNVGFGNVNVGVMEKSNNEDVSHFTFTNCTENIKIWLTTYVNVNGIKETASEGALLSKGTYLAKTTIAKKDQTVTIEASREHLFNPHLDVSGKWLA